MPSKFISKPRAWGTRFDSLPSSPPPSSQSSNETTSAPAGASPLSLAQSDIPSTQRRNVKMPHDASVFVGSLPTNIDHHDLTRMLTDHLAEHGEVKFVKVVRDSKGGVCAFVQCESAASASSLIQTLQSRDPKPFLGRILRYEPARAFRTLTPMQFSPPNNMDDNVAMSPKVEATELPLPFAMRLCRSQHSKFPNVLYNAEALDVQNQNPGKQHSEQVDPVLHLEPMYFDETTLQAIAAFFGPLEHFGRYGVEQLSHSDAGSSESPIEPDEDHDGEPEEKSYESQSDDFVEEEPEQSSIEENGEEEPVALPFPHDAPRKENMDSGCFEIKWTHRDDCVSALMTLRRVPHLTVTWAHQPPGPSGSDRHGFVQRFQNPNGLLYPMFTQPRFAGFPRELYKEPHPHQPVGSDVRPAVKPIETRLIPEIPAYINKKPVTPLQSDVDWSDRDFPPLPLTDTKIDLKANMIGAWSEKQHTVSESGQNERSSSSSSQLLDAVLSPHVADQNSYEHTFAEDGGQELTMPPTPGLGMSPITPRTPSMLFPPTPTCSVSDPQIMDTMRGYEVARGESYIHERVIDPTTLFIGGLEMFGPGSWDEEKVGKFFGKYGGLESVKVVRPPTGRAAFAFVKFNNTESPARAVSEEHNRVYDGRAIRVQLRDCNPPRGTFRGRGRGGGRLGGNPRSYYEDNSTPQDREFNEYTIRNPYQFSDKANITRRIVASPSDGNIFKQAAIHSSPPMSQPNIDVDIPGASTGTSQTETYREWYDIEEDPTPINPPSPSRPASQHSAAPPQNIPPPIPGAYYGPPWIQPYAPHMPYPGAYMYPGFPIPTPPQPLSSGTSESSGPATSPVVHPMQQAGAWPHMSMYGAYIPYPAFPPKPADQNSTSQPPPLLPTGFIQNEHGGLIPVYPPDAIDQYMNNGQSSSKNNSAGTSPVSWPQFPHLHPAYAVSGQMPRLNVPQQQMPTATQMSPSVSASWMTPSQSARHFMSPSTSPGMPMPLHGATPFRSHDGNLSSHGNSSTTRRGGRGGREQPGQYNNRGRPFNTGNRNQPSRPSKTMPHRGPDGTDIGRHPPFGGNLAFAQGDWSQWR